MGEQEQPTPMEQGRPTIFVFVDANSEVQVGMANHEFDVDEMIYVLDIAKAKLSLLGYQAMRREMAAQTVRQSLLQGVR